MRLSWLPGIPHPRISYGLGNAERVRQPGNNPPQDSTPGEKKGLLVHFLVEGQRWDGTLKGLTKFLLLGVLFLTIWFSLNASMGRASP